VDGLVDGLDADEQHTVANALGILNTAMQKMAQVS
jgi:hypothetical protein